MKSHVTLEVVCYSYHMTVSCKAWAYYAHTIISNYSTARLSLTEFPSKCASKLLLSRSFQQKSTSRRNSLRFFARYWSVTSLSLRRLLSSCFRQIYRSVTQFRSGQWETSVSAPPYLAANHDSGNFAVILLLLICLNCVVFYFASL